MKNKRLKLLVLLPILLLGVVACDDNDENYPTEKFGAVEVVRVFDTAVTTGITFANKNVGYISGFDPETQEPVIAKTTKGGVSWKKQSFNSGDKTGLSILDIAAYSTDKLCAIVKLKDKPNLSPLFYSDDAGKQWTFEASGGFSYNNVIFKDDKFGFLVDEVGNLDRIVVHDWRSNNSTRLALPLYYRFSIDKVYCNDSFGGFNNILFADFSPVGYALGSNKKHLAKTENNGENWYQLVTTPEEEITSFCVRDEWTVYLFTSENNVYRTTDGGSTWMLLNSSSTNPVLSSIVCNNHVYFATDNALYKTGDEFNTIEELVNTKSSQNVEGIHKTFLIAPRIVAFLSKHSIIIVHDYLY
ncbi:hypothetical protein D0T50_05225 [Bacteroides sp. 214]|uniref:WD40/YVTN/BNR-like repeat-containing protein n=1 Tax=Bacteroides sp. 214 TaxID=2302935 RepID=UPI0013D76555|nr:hypothetical protein [Bacteroides sp. 214]NDW12290.1 hypothetical protein [Bacteroides sp. 214]